MDPKITQKIEKFKNARNKKRLFQLLENELWEERIAVLKAFEEIGNNDDCQLLLPYIDDKFEKVSLQAIKTIKSIGTISSDIKNKIVEVETKWENLNKIKQKEEEENRFQKKLKIKNLLLSEIIHEYKNLKNKDEIYKTEIINEINNRGGIDLLIQKRESEIIQIRNQNLKAETKELNNELEDAISKRKTGRILLFLGLLMLLIAYRTMKTDPSIFFVIPLFIGILILISGIIKSVVHSKEISNIKNQIRKL